MKFTWGHGVTIGFGLFVVYILYFVYQSFNQNNDLVSEDYYAQEVIYQDRIDEINNAKAFSNDISVVNAENGLTITFPREAASSADQGELHFFRPSDKSKDLKLPLQLSADNKMLVPYQVLAKGRYELHISWTVNDEAYYLTKDIVI